MSELIVKINQQIVKRIKLVNPTYAIGRSQKCDIILPERTISSQHARIINTGEDCFLEDTDSTNGVYVNHRATQQHLLIDNDIINIGKYQIVFRSSVNLATQLRQLSVHPRLAGKSVTPWLEISTGRKQGNIIPLEREQITLGEESTGHIMIKRGPKNGYLLQGTTENEIPETVQLADNDRFRVGNVELVFHAA